MRTICLDLDGSLLRVDTLHESFVAAVKVSLWGALKIVALNIRNKPKLKQELFRLGRPRIDMLPVNEAVLNYLKDAKANGPARIILATGACEEVAEAISDRFDEIDEIISSSEMNNLVGESKAVELVSRFGLNGFEYIGDDSRDVYVWNKSSRPILVGNRMPRGCEGINFHTVLAATSHRRYRDALSLLRPHQWIKNLLIFLPSFTAQQLNPSAIPLLSITFISMCFIASAGYAINDILDVENDRGHPTKKNRPLASGVISLRAGAALALGLIAGGLTIAASMSGTLMGLVAIYLLGSLFYSNFVKKIPYLDIVFLGAFYLYRMVIGGAVLNIETSAWLLVFAGSIFYSLAIAKRLVEILRVTGGGLALSGPSIEHGDVKLATRAAYQVSDVWVLLGLGPATHAVALLIFALYINSENASLLYPSLGWLWIIPAAQLYWMPRFWSRVLSGKMDCDPVRFAIRDNVTWLVASISSFACVAAALGF